MSSSSLRKSCCCRLLLAIGLLFAARGAEATGLLVPTDPSVGPLGIAHQRVNVVIRDQAAVTRVEQEFRNHTSRQLEAYYLFPLPEGAGVKDFAMWIDGKRVQAELVEASRARQVYEDIVRRMRDPGLLEHLGKNLWRVRVFPIPPQGRQKIEISYQEIVQRDAGIAEYVYPLRTANEAVHTEDDFTIRLELHSTAPLKSVYSPSHEVGVAKEGEHKAVVGFEARRYPLNKDFRLFWTSSDKEVGLAALTFRESPAEPGYFLLLLSPNVELQKSQRVPRDLVFVLDTSGSMQGEKMAQAKRALLFCLKSLDESDRFGLVSFATTVNLFEPALRPVTKSEIEKAGRWIEELSAVGGTAIDEALRTALDLRTAQARNFTIVFLTDGQPTIGETDPKNILEAVKRKNEQGTRIFVFGAGDDVNTHLLDQLAELTRATSVYVRPHEDLEVKVSSFYGKISHPVLADLRLVVDRPDVRFSETFPPQLPDLFHGGQLVVLGRYSGQGATALRLQGTLGQDTREFVYEVSLPAEKRDNDFVPGLWARRKVGYLLDQIRLKGENKELVDEVIHLAKRYGIATPYTSYLVVPDQTPGIAGAPQPWRPQLGREAAEGFSSRAAFERSVQVQDAAGTTSLAPQQKAKLLEEERVGKARAQALKRVPIFRPLTSGPRAPALDSNVHGLIGQSAGGPAGKDAVDVAEVLKSYKEARRLDAAASLAFRTVGAARFVYVNGLWVDESLGDKSDFVKVKYLGKAYFRILELVPQAKPVFAMGPAIVWVTPSGKALVIDEIGAESLSDEEIRSLFEPAG